MGGKREKGKEEERKGRVSFWKEKRKRRGGK